VGNARSWEPAFDKLRSFRTYLSHPHTTFPTWLVFRDIAADCSDPHVKDRFGHWHNKYVKLIAQRVICVITKKPVPAINRHGMKDHSQACKKVRLQSSDHLLNKRVLNSNRDNELIAPAVSKYVQIHS
jgi:hypothetical protein